MEKMCEYWEGDIKGTRPSICKVTGERCGMLRWCTTINGLVMSDLFKQYGCKVRRHQRTKERLEKLEKEGE